MILRKISYDMFSNLELGLGQRETCRKITYSTSSLDCIVLDCIVSSGLSFETFLVGELSGLLGVFFRLTFDPETLVNRFRLPSPDFSALAAPLFSLPKALADGADARL